MTGKARRGFASMDSEKRKAIARLGGQISHARGTAHKFTSDEARQAGAIGGWVVSQDREHMSQLGRLGAEVKLRKRRQEKSQADKKTVRK